MVCGLVLYYKKMVKNIKPPNKHLTTTMPTVTYQATASFNDCMDPTDQKILIINNYMCPEEFVVIFPYVTSCCA